MGGFIFASADSKEPPSMLSRIISFISKSFGVVIILTAVILGVLETNEDLRKMSFSMLCAKMTQGSDLDVLRCGKEGRKGFICCN